jgi:hypothetical protein
MIELATCGDCADWAGTCKNGHKDRRLKISCLACSSACEQFKPRSPAEEVCS